MNEISRLMILCAGLSVPLFSLDGKEARPEFVRRLFSRENFVVAFFPQSTNWIGLETSQDLRSWRTLVNLSTGRTNPIVFVDVTASGTERQFYRLSSPGITVEEARSWWAAQGLTHYSYRVEGKRQEVVENVGGASPAGLVPPPESVWIEWAGVVTVEEGTRTISEGQVVIDGAPKSPEEIMEEDFPGITEAFDWLEAAQQSGANRVEVGYDTLTGVPLRAFAQWNERFPWLEWRISEFTILQSQEE